MKIIVTGGAGFIGSHIVDALLAEKHEVMIIDNLSTGRMENINAAAKFVEADITDFDKMDQLFVSEKPEVVYHLAAQIDVRKSVSEPITDAKTNILASLNLIRLSHSGQVKKFIFSSTGGAIYGDTDNRPTPEENPEWPLSPYGIAKLTVDKYLYYFREAFGLQFISLRYGNVYGPRQNPHGEAGVVAIFMNKMLKGEQPVINGDGKQVRDYVFVSDVVSANMTALDNFSKSGIFNVGTGIETSVTDLFKEINGNFDHKFKEEHGPAKPGEQMTSCLDYGHIHSDLGWTPKIEFREGIRKTYEWFKINNQ